MDSTHIVTRFPPSPTGYLHIGGARTALFNWLYTKQNGGKFILRIEDTDEERSSEEATKAIIESMEWLGLTWDEGPYFQSKRYDLYNAFIEKLLKKGLAYHCHCSQEELNTRREEAKKKGLKPKYDGKCRNLGLGPEPGSVIRLKTPLTGKTRFQDLIKGPISFDNEELDDLIIRRSNGSPTYHLAVVADDIDLGVNVIIRGDDHVNNTPRQIQIYHAIGEPLPRYAHVPMILGPDKARLSKRHGAMSVLEYREMGYLPHALLNALVRLGWSYGDQEKFTMDELVEKFSLESVGKAAGVFNYEKLLDLNAQYIREASDDFLARELELFLQRIGFEDLDTEKLKEVASLLKMRSKTLVEMAEAARFFFEEDISFEEKGDKKFLQPEILPYLESLYPKLTALAAFDKDTLEECLAGFLKEQDIPFKNIAQPLRMVLTGKTASPGLFEVMDVLGSKKVLQRMEKGIDHIRKKVL